MNSNKIERSIIDKTAKNSFSHAKQLTIMHDFAIIALENRFRKRVRRKVGVNRKNSRASQGVLREMRFDSALEMTKGATM